MPAPAGGLALVILLLAAIVPYLNSFWGSYHFDDGQVIERNEGIRSWDGLLHARPVNRWLTFFTFFVNYKLHGLWWMPGWHAVNVLLHAGCVLSAYWVLGRMLRQREGVPGPLPFYAALLFAVHPLAGEPVNYIQARNVLMYTLFSLLSLGGAIALHQAGDRRGRLGGIGLLLGCFFLAAFTKEVGLLLPPTLVGLYWLVFVVPRAANKRRQWVVALSSIGGLAVVGTVVLTAANAWPSIAQRLRVDGQWLASYFLAEVTVFWRYVFLAVLPLPWKAGPLGNEGLSVDHYVREYVSRPGEPMAYSLGQAEVFLGLLGLIVLIGLAIWQHRRRPVLSFSLLALPLALAPYFVMTSPEMMVEYRFYPPLAFFCVPAAAGLIRLAGRWRRRTGPVVVAALCAGMAALALCRNRDWHTNVALWEDAASKEPQKARTVNGLAWALATDPTDKDPVRALYLALKTSGSQLERARQLARGGGGDPVTGLKQALAMLEEDMRLNRNRVTGYVNEFMLDTLSEAYYVNGMHDAAIELESKLAEGWPDQPFFRQQCDKYIAARDARNRQISATTIAGGSRPAAN